MILLPPSLYLLVFTQELKKWTMKIGRKILFFKTEDGTTEHLSAREWIGRKITFPFLFQPCPKKALVMKILCSHGRVYEISGKKPSLWNQERDPNVQKVWGRSRLFCQFSLSFVWRWPQYCKTAHQHKRLNHEKLWLANQKTGKRGHREPMWLKDWESERWRRDT